MTSTTRTSGAPDGPADWRPDSLLEGYHTRFIDVPDAVRAPGEPDDFPITACVIRRGHPAHGRAMVYLHGWSDYFFQTHLAEVVESWGFDFYAVELRRYGRNLVPGLLGGYVADLSEYFAELDAALALVRADGHEQVTLMAHSTGGLVGVLWADQRPGQLQGIILNSPWLDLHGSALLRAFTSTLAQGLSTRNPAMALPLPDNGFYARTIDAAQGGEWNFSADLKANPAFAIRPGWLRAIIKGHDQVKTGLDIGVPVLCLISARSDFRRTWDEALKSADTVLDVKKLASAAVKLGRHLTLVRIDGGLHDLVLSRQEVRQRVFAEMAHWVRCYLD